MEIEAKTIRDFSVVEAFRFHAPCAHNILDSEPGSAMALANRMVTSISVFSIRSIFYLRAKIEVLGIAAGRIVASVKDIQTGRDFAVNEFPCQPVAVVMDAITTSYPVAITRNSALPWPACVRAFALIDALPKLRDARPNYRKSIHKRGSVMRPTEASRTIRPLAALHGTDFADVSHDDPPSRIGGQGRRPVASRLRPAFYGFSVVVSTP
jgi:hypothetical protein